LTLRGALNGEKILDDSVREYQAGPAAVRVHEEAVGRVGVLPVEDCGQAFDSAPQLGMSGLPRLGQRQGGLSLFL
jgi:hypothetical protein